MVTLQKYLYGPWTPEPPPGGMTPDDWRELFLLAIDSVDAHVLRTEDADLRQQLGTVRSAAQSLTQPEAAQASVQLATVIRIYRERVDRTSRDQSQDLYRILTSLNDALLCLAAGNSRTVSRLKQVEASLERATTINDIAALKSKLAEIVNLVREDMRKERAEFDEDRVKIESQIQRVRSGPWLRSELPGRDDAIARLSRIVGAAGRTAGTAPGEAGTPAGETGIEAGISLNSDSYAAAVFVFSRMRELVRRYGDSAADNLVAELVHRRIHFPDTDPLAYRWASDVAVVCLRCPDGLEQLQAVIEPQIETPFEHRVYLGSRVAVLRVAVHWVVLPVTGTVTSLVEQIDSFARKHI